MVLKTLGSVFGPESIQIKSYVGIDLRCLNRKRSVNPALPLSA